MVNKNENLFKRAAKFIAGRFHTEDIFWETEKSSNLLMALGMLALCVILIICWIILLGNTFDYDLLSVTVLLILCIAFFAPIAVYCLLVRGDKRWLKFVLMVFMTAGISLAHTFLSYAAVLLLVVPVALSVRYYSASFTRGTAILNGIVYIIVVYCSVIFNYSGEYDLNYLTFPAGTVFTIGESQWLYDAVVEVGFDKEMLKHNMMTIYLFPKLLEYALASAICVAVARRGHNMVLNEANAAAESASIKTELSLAAEIQLSALPCVFPAFPEHEQLELYATMSPAENIGGDFYDYFRIDDDHVALVIADVSGKGVPAALFMMTGKTLIKNFAQGKLVPSEVFTSVNAQLCENNQAELFITAWLGILEVSTGKLTYVNAGHCRPLLRHKGETEFHPLSKIHGLALACFDDTEYTQSEVRLGPGDELYLYTDGVTETSTPEKGFFGTARITEFLNAHGHEPLQELLPDIRRELDAFTGDAPQFDDITMLMLRIEETDVVAADTAEENG